MNTKQEPSPYRVLVVFGHTDKCLLSISAECRARTVRALELYHDGDLIIFTGGACHSGGMSEARLMRAVAARWPIHPQLILLEEESITTIQKVENVLREHAYDLQEKQVVLISSFHHIFRCAVIWRLLTKGPWPRIEFPRPWWRFISLKKIWWEMRSIIDFFFYYRRGKLGLEHGVRAKRKFYHRGKLGLEHGVRAKRK